MREGRREKGWKRERDCTIVKVLRMAYLWKSRQEVFGGCGGL